MNQAEIEAVLQAAFGQCDAEGVPLRIQQKEILLRVIIAAMESEAAKAMQGMVNVSADASSLLPRNPLDELTPEQRQVLLQFVQEQDDDDRPWKMRLLNDWLEDRDSGTVQFVREQYGMQWLDRVQPYHLAEYREDMTLKLKVGDRIDVSNGLWEWVQDDGPCIREWFACTVIAITEDAANSSSEDDNPAHTNCTIRFDNGMEYEIQSVYGWNRYNWRWAEP